MSKQPATGGRDARGKGRDWVRHNILGLVAIFIALSGTAVAAQVANDPGAQEAVKKKKKKGPPGPAGPQGAQGIQGIQGPAGPNAVTVVRATIPLAPPGNTANFNYANCPGGTRATGGGVGWAGAVPTEDRIVNSGPTDATGLFTATVTGSVPVSWYGSVVTTGATARTAYVWAICQ